jgi:hypothetical protein
MRSLFDEFFNKMDEKFQQGLQQMEDKVNQKIEEKKALE